MLMQTGGSQTDDQLIKLIDETGEWLVTGKGGRELGVFPSLNVAVKRAVNHTASDRYELSIWRFPQRNITIAERQILRLSTALQQREDATKNRPLRRRRFL